MNRLLMLFPMGLGMASFLGTVAVVEGCSSPSSGAGGSGSGLNASVPSAGPDVPLPSGVSLQSDVVTVHGGASVIKKVSSDHGTWTLDKGASGVSGLTVGKVLLIAGVDCARATAIHDNGDGTLDVTVAPVSIVEVIQEGSLQWQAQSIDTDQGFMGQVPYALVIGSEVGDAGAAGDGGADGGGLSDGGCGDAGDGGVSCQLRTAGALHLEGNPSNNPTNAVSVTIGNWTVQVSGATSSAGALDLTASAAWQPNSPGFTLPGDPASTLGATIANVGIGVHLSNIKGASGSLAVSGGKITNANITSSMAGSADLSAAVGTQSGSQFPKQALLKLPIAAEFPIYWGPIPMYLSFQAAILIQPSLATKGATMQVANHIEFGGSAGVTFANGAAAPAGVPSSVGPMDPLGTIDAPAQIGAMAMVFAVQAPRVGFGVGTMAFGVGVKAGVFVDVVNSFGVTIAPVTSLVPCREAEWQLSSHGGGEVNIGVGVTTVNASHQIDLVSIPASAPEAWYTPMVSACKP